MKPKRSLSVVGLCLFCKELVDDRSVFRVAVQCGVDPSVVKRHYGRHITSAHYKDVLIKTSAKELL
jgi:hypothetical protein